MQALLARHADLSQRRQLAALLEADAAQRQEVRRLQQRVEARGIKCQRARSVLLQQTRALADAAQCIQVRPWSARLALCWPQQQQQQQQRAKCAGHAAAHQQDKL